jgi:hypothetical protein
MRRTTSSRPVDVTSHPPWPWTLPHCSGDGGCLIVAIGDEHLLLHHSGRHVVLLLIVIVFLLVLILAGCGGEDAVVLACRLKIPDQQRSFVPVPRDHLSTPPEIGLLDRKPFRGVSYLILYQLKC